MKIVVGTDIVRIERVERSYRRFGERFLSRFLNEEEYPSHRRPSSIAGLWAAKEAAAKALGCGIGQELAFHQILVKKSAKGAPVLSFAQAIEAKYGITQCSVSISHDGGFALAVVAITCKE